MCFVRASGLWSFAFGVVLSACVVAPPPREPDSAPLAERSSTPSAAASDGVSAELGELSRDLEAELAAVEAALAKLAPEMNLTRWEQLAERRLSILVALLQVEQAIALDLPLPPPSAAAPPAADKPEQGANTLAERVIADGARRVAAARRAQQVAGADGRGRRRPGFYEKRTEYDFEDDTIAGDLLRPANDWHSGASPEGEQKPAQPGPYPTVTPEVQIDPNDVPPDETPADQRGASVVNHSAPPANVMPAVARHLDRMLECFPAEQRHGDGVTMRVRTVLASDGSFREPRVTADAELAPIVLGCVTEVLSRVRVPPPAGGSRVISFPLRLRGSR